MSSVDLPARPLVPTQLCPPAAGLRVKKGASVTLALCGVALTVCLQSSAAAPTMADTTWQGKASGKEKIARDCADVTAPPTLSSAPALPVPLGNSVALERGLMGAMSEPTASAGLLVCPITLRLMGSDTIPRAPANMCLLNCVGHQSPYPSSEWK